MNTTTPDNRYQELSKPNQHIIDQLVNTIASTGNSQLVTICVNSVIQKSIKEIHEIHRGELISQETQQ